MRILLVDDNAAFRLHLARWLTRAGHTVDESGDGNDALALMHRNDYGLVLLDVILPGLDGVAVARAKILDARLARMPVALMSGLDADRVRGMCSQPTLVAPTTLLSKPFTMESLDALIRSVAGSVDGSKTKDAP